MLTFKLLQLRNELGDPHLYHGTVSSKFGFNTLQSLKIGCHISAIVANCSTKRQIDRQTLFSCNESWSCNICRALYTYVWPKLTFNDAITCVNFHVLRHPWSGVLMECKMSLQCSLSKEAKRINFRTSPCDYALSGPYRGLCLSPWLQCSTVLSYSWSSNKFGKAVKNVLKHVTLSCRANS